MPALAASPTNDAARAAARAAGYEGIRAYESGRFTVAVDKLDRAFGVVKVPTLGLWYARALVKTGKLVEASERYGEVIRLEITEGKVKEQKQAQAEAAEELEALKPKIPALTITVVDAADDSEVLLDGSPIPSKLFGLATPANPGVHRIQAKQGAQLVEQVVTLSESESKSVELRLNPAGAGATKLGTAGPVREHPAATSGAASKTAPVPEEPRGRTQKTIGWISLGLGGAATVAGVVTGLMAKSKRDQLDNSGSCRGTNCLPVVDDMRSSYNHLRSAATVSFIVGAVGIGAGTTLLLTTPKPKEAAVAAWLGIGSVGLTGRF